jgi:hypothetical protein
MISSIFTHHASRFTFHVWLLLLCPLACVAAEPVPSPSWQQSIVTIEVNRKQYDYYQPWTKRTRRLQKAGTVIADKQILTTADEMYDRTLIRLQKNGRGRWWIGEVSWIDYPANLALVTVADEDFWKDLKPAKLGKPGLATGPLQILRWREGKLESRAAEFTQFTVREGQLSSVDVLALETSSEIQGVGWGEPLIANSHIVGFIWAQDARTCVAMPASSAQAIVDARKKGTYRGLGYFHFFWQQAENPATLSNLKLTGSPRGVVVIEVPKRPDNAENVLKPHDIILNIDGFDLDVQGDYTDPDFGPVMLENLAIRGKWAGDDVKMQISRDGKPLDITYRLPKFNYTNSLVPFATYDDEPDYFIVGGLVFQPLTDSYLQAWGTDWKRRSPFRLYYYNNESPTKERPALVILSQVLPDPYNIGYQDQRSLVLQKVNGKPVHYLAELREALQKPAGEFHTFEFSKGETLQRIVLAAGDDETTATARVLKRYGIAEASRF